MTTILSGARLVLPDSTIERGSLVIDDDGLIADVWTEPMPRAPGSEWHDLTGRIIVPGFIDVHVHGVEGVRHARHCRRRRDAGGEAAEVRRHRLLPDDGGVSAGGAAASAGRHPRRAAQSGPRSRGRPARASREQLHQPRLPRRAAGRRAFAGRPRRSFRASRATSRFRASRSSTRSRRRGPRSGSSPWRPRWTVAWSWCARSPTRGTSCRSGIPPRRTTRGWPASTPEAGTPRTSSTACSRSRTERPD